jgi:hypothetical protein
MFRRTGGMGLAAAIAGGVLAIGIPGTAAEPTAAKPAATAPTAAAQAAAAQAATGDVELSGNFHSDPGDEWFSYRASPTSGTRIRLHNGGAPGGALTVTAGSRPLYEQYRPVAGHFLGGELDQVFLYAPGAEPDGMIHYIAGGEFSALLPYTVGGDYHPVAGDFTGDGLDDILWYAPGVSADPLWDFNPGGGYTVVQLNNNGNYRPAVASIGKDATDDIVWYSPASSCGASPAAPTILWDFDQGRTTYTTETLPITGGDYEPFAFDRHGDGWRGDDIFWYSPTGSASVVWEYSNGVRTERIEPLSGDYTPIAGDYLGDGQEDVIWTTPTQFVLWDHNGDDRWTYDRARTW